MQLLIRAISWNLLLFKIHTPLPPINFLCENMSVQIYVGEKFKMLHFWPHFSVIAKH